MFDLYAISYDCTDEEELKRTWEDQGGPEGRASFGVTVERECRTRVPRRRSLLLSLVDSRKGGTRLLKLLRSAIRAIFELKGL